MIGLILLLLTAPVALLPKAYLGAVIVIVIAAAGSMSRRLGAPSDLPGAVRS